MLSILKKPTPVEVIHAEFDSAQDRILDECDKVLAELQIPTETQIEKKASIMEELGFVNSETIQQARVLKERNQKIEQKINLTTTQAKSIRYFKQKYPFEKFITVDELNKICEKYNLIHAPAENYIKDIPERNVLEMKNCKELDVEDSFKTYKVLQLREEYFNINTPEFIVKACVKGIELKNIKHNGYNNNECINQFFNLERNTMYYKYNSMDFKITQIHKSGLFVAAPKSHFNLDGLTEKSKFGFFNVTVTEVKDPVVFEYCKNDICRIITKWGTDDDQSYLDPSLTNEIFN